MTAAVNDRRRSARGLLVSLVIVIFIGIAANAVVMGIVADQGKRLERQNADIRRLGYDVLRLVEEFRPCNPDDPPDSPGCERQRRTDALVSSVLADLRNALATGLAAHDANTTRQHDALRARHGVTRPLPPSTPITVAPRLTAAAPAPSPSPATGAAVTTTTRPRPTTTTTCPKRGNSGRCR